MQLRTLTPSQAPPRSPDAGASFPGITITARHLTNSITRVLCLRPNNLRRLLRPRMRLPELRLLVLRNASSSG